MRSASSQERYLGRGECLLNRGAAAASGGHARNRTPESRPDATRKAGDSDTCWDWLRGLAAEQGGQRETSGFFGFLPEIFPGGGGKRLQLRTAGGRQRFHVAKAAFELRVRRPQGLFRIDLQV